MSSRRSVLLATVLCGVALAGAAPALSQSYGLGDQVLAIGATDFRPAAGSTYYLLNSDDGYLYGEAGIFWAPLHLPDGAEIFQICLYANIPDADSAVVGGLYAEKLVPGGENPGFVNVAGSNLVENIAIGYGTVCTDPLSYVIHETADVDGDGTTEHVAYVFNFQRSLNSALGGVRVFWRRQVSPAPGTATFNDVPTSHPFFQFIEALSASGITAGCQVSPPLYCPDASLTRGQMAVFLSKALGLHWPN